MSISQLDVVLERIAEWVGEARPPKVSMLWHGGEPLMMGRDFYRAVLKRCAQIESDTGVAIRHVIQSNITLVDDQWAELLGELLSQRRVGSSYDPLAPTRLLRGGASYEEAWQRGYEILRRAGVHVGVVCVVHQGHMGRARELYHAFREMDYDGGLRINPIYAAGLARGRSSLHITPQEWGAFLCDLYEAWDEDGRRIRVDPLEGWDRLARGDGARLACAFSGHCTRSFTGIRNDGAVFTCGRSMDEGLYSFGNIYETPLATLLASPLRRAFLNRVKWLQQGECAGCRWWAFCHGGCPNDAMISYGDAMRRTPWCEGRRLFLNRTYGRKLVRMPQEPEDAQDLFDSAQESKADAPEKIRSSEDAP